jgi:hypothetical protein
VVVLFGCTGVRFPSSAIGKTTTLLVQSGQMRRVAPHPQTLTHTHRGGGGFMPPLPFFIWTLKIFQFHFTPGVGVMEETAVSLDMTMS